MKLEKEKSMMSMFKHGLKYEFMDGDNEITTYCRSISGMEKVYINGELLSKKRTYRLSSRHKFNYEGHEYEVSFVTTKLLRGGGECTILKDNMLIGRDEEIILSVSHWKDMLVICLFSFSLGFAMSYGSSAIFKLFE